MKVVTWLNDPMSAINGIALVRVEKNETADIEKMLVLVDGDSVGHFGISANLVSTKDDFPAEEYAKQFRRSKTGFTKLAQFGFPGASQMKQGTRYYKVFVNRD